MKEQNNFSEWQHEDSQSARKTIWVVYNDYGGGTTFIGAYTNEEVAQRVANRSSRYSIDEVEVDEE
jgi:hypothetical protein